MNVRVTLNGTHENPWHRYGFSCNPFPVIADAHPIYGEANRILHALDSDPIVDEDDLRVRLTGCTPEFIEGCVQRFRPGERVGFVIEFPDPVS